MASPKIPPAEMGLFDHLAELRAVLLQSAVAALVCSVVGWFFSAAAVDLLIRPAIGPVGDLKFITPTGAFLLRFKTALGLGLFVAAPVILWRLWSFVVPGLLQRERRVLYPMILTSVLLFYTGAAFAYFIILPTSLKFLVGFATATLKPMLTAEHYFAFAIRIVLAFGAVFQFPLVVAILTFWEVIGPDFLQKYWRYGVVVVFVLSAILTPPDVASQLLMAGPVLVLYLLSLLLAKWIARSRRREKSLPERTDDDAGQNP